MRTQRALTDLQLKVEDLLRGNVRIGERGGESANQHRRENDP